MWVLCGSCGCHLDVVWVMCECCMGGGCCVGVIWMLYGCHVGDVRVWVSCG